VNKINTAFQYGPNEMVKTVKLLTGLPINHYVEVNFVGFQDLVNALGGVPICIEKPLRDTLAGLNLPHAGCYNLKGGQALAFVRARHIEGDVIPDFSRISRQQQFIRAVIQKAMSAGAIAHLPALIKAIESNLVIDDRLNLYTLQDLTRKLATVGQSGVDFRIVPATPVTIDSVDYLDLVQPNASKLFLRMKNGHPLGNIGRAALGTPISPANITVRVFDAGSKGKAQDVASYLERAGFVVLPVETAPARLGKSQILRGEGKLGEATVLASYVSSTLPSVRDDADTSGADCAIVIGPDFQGIEGR
jgi:LCP family protein required for cell wall assembly